MTTAADIIVGGTAGAPTRLGIGSSGQVLSVSGGGAVVWATPAFTNPMTTAGDIIVGGAAGAATRLGIGSTGQVLSVSGGGNIVWASAGSGPSAAAKYIVQTADASITNAQALGALSTGIMKSTTTTGVVSIAVPGTDYVPITYIGAITLNMDELQVSSSAADALLSVAAPSNAYSTYVQYVQTGTRYWKAGVYSADGLFHIAAGNFSSTDVMIMSYNNVTVNANLTAVGQATTPRVNITDGSAPSAPTTGVILYSASGQLHAVNSTADSALMTNPMTTASDLIVGGSSGAPTRLGVGSTRQVLSVNSGGDIVWVNPAFPITNMGDLIVGDSSGDPTRLGIGSTGQVLSVSGGTAAWTTPPSGASLAFGMSAFIGGAATVTDASITSASTIVCTYYSLASLSTQIQVTVVATGSFSATGDSSNSFFWIAVT